MNRREAISALIALPAVTRISKSEIGPNDVIVIEVQGHISDKSAAYITDRLKEIWPNHKCVVLSDGMTMRFAVGAAV